VLILLATIGLSWAGVLDKKNAPQATPAVAIDGAHSHGDSDSHGEREAPREGRQSCPYSSSNSGIIRSTQNEVIHIDPATNIYVQHKVDIDSLEDRCINAVLIEHQPERGCKYVMRFDAVRGSHKLQLTSLRLDADSWCPSWGDHRETGESGSSRSYTKAMGSDGLSLQLSRSRVPDHVADRSCTELSMATGGEVFLTRGIGGRSERFSFEKLRFSGRYDSVGEPSSFCPSPPPVQEKTVYKAPKENAFRNTAVLGFVGHEPIPNFPAIDVGFSAMQQLGDRFTMRADISGGPFKHNALYANFMFGQVTGTPGLRPYFGLRMGGLDVSESSVVAIGPNLGLETNRAVRSSNFYGSFEVTPVFFGEELRAYMSSDSELYTNAGVMFKLHVGVFLR
jgi:hypothetical protein